MLCFSAERGGERRGAVRVRREATTYWWETV